MHNKSDIQQRSRLGTLLVHRGMISRQQLDEALTLQQQKNLKLGEVLIQKGWITEKQLANILRRQSRYRLVAALSAMLVAPFQPFMASANAADSNVAQAEQYIERTGIKSLSEQDLGGITAQGAGSSYERLLDIVNNKLDNQNDEQAAITTLEALASSMLPGTDLLDAEIEISGVTYEPGPRTTINTDGSLDVQLPTNIKQIAFRNVRVAGAEGQHFGDVVVRDLSFGAGTSVKVLLH